MVELRVLPNSVPQPQRVEPPQNSTPLSFTPAIRTAPKSTNDMIDDAVQASTTSAQTRVRIQAEREAADRLGLKVRNTTYGPAAGNLGGVANDYADRLINSVKPQAQLPTQPAPPPQPRPVDRGPTY